MVSFGRVVVDDVQDHFDARAVQRVNHLLELAAPTCRRSSPEAYVWLGREIAERVVAPVVRQAAIDQVPVVEEIVDRASVRPP